MNTLLVHNIHIKKGVFKLLPDDFAYTFIYASHLATKEGFVASLKVECATALIRSCKIWIVYKNVLDLSPC